MFTNIKEYQNSLSIKESNEESFEDLYSHYIVPAKRSVQRCLGAIWNRILNLDKKLKKSATYQDDIVRINNELMEIVKNLHTIDLTNYEIPQQNDTIYERLINYPNISIYEIECKDYEGTLKSLLEHIKTLGNKGNSFKIIVDPEATEEAGRKDFYWDGDGRDSIGNITIKQKFN